MSSHYLFDRPHWHISGLKDFGPFFEALPKLAPQGSFVGLAGAFTSRELTALLPQSRTVQNVPFLPDQLPDEFGDATFLPVSAETAILLEDLENRRMWPGFLLFVVVIANGQSILEWYDAPDDPIAVAGSISEDAIHDFTAATGAAYERADPS